RRRKSCSDLIVGHRCWNDAVILCTSLSIVPVNTNGTSKGRTWEIDPELRSRSTLARACFAGACASRIVAHARSRSPCRGTRVIVNSSNSTDDGARRGPTSWIAKDQPLLGGAETGKVATLAAEPKSESAINDVVTSVADRLTEQNACRQALLV